jgi:hypothetical protein
VRSILVVTSSFLPLVTAQAKARRADPRLVVIDHPIGGLSPEEFAGREEAAYRGVVAELRRMEEL